VKADVFKYLQNSPKKYDLIFADPPYAMPNLQNLVSMVRPHLIDGGIFLFEHQPRLVFDPPPTREKDYGSSKLSIFE
jgi:16S rRNA G966 N2-methylase RsmD